MYHIELRQFPHNLCRFNLSDEQLHAVVEPWARAHWVELGERKWSPHQARLTILEGPRIPVQQLSMGRGWRNAQRQSKDVTERVLAAVREPGGACRGTPPKDSGSDLCLQADSLALELLSLLEHAPAPLSRAWQLTQARFPERAASECLAVAERAVRSLLQRRLIVLLDTRGAASGSGRHPDEARSDGILEGVEEEDVDLVLRAVESWTGTGESAAVRLSRA